MGAMNRYVTLQQLGDGTYGSVVLGQRVDTGEKVMHIKIERSNMGVLIMTCSETPNGFFFWLMSTL